MTVFHNRHSESKKKYRAQHTTTQLTPTGTVAAVATIMFMVLSQP